MSDTSNLSLSVADLDAAQAGFLARLRLLAPADLDRPTPCAKWTVHGLINHVVLGELGYALLLRGGSGPEFLALQDRDAVGADAVAAYQRASTDCRAAFGVPGVLDRTVDYPLGAVPGWQLLGLRLTETLVHTWDLARATGTDDRLDPRLVDWIVRNLDWTYRGVAERPHRRQHDARLLRRPGCCPAARGQPAGPAVAPHRPGVRRRPGRLTTGGGPPGFSGACQPRRTGAAC